jgi:hypothetical protein
VKRSPLQVIGRTLGGVKTGIRARWKLFMAVAVGVLIMDIALPPLLLSLVRKPLDYFTFNPWLRKLPDYLASGPGSLAERLNKGWQLALFWFSSDNPYGIEWGFAVTAADLGRFLVMSLLVGGYFAVWAHHRDQRGATRRGLGVGGQGGIVGACSSVFGIATGGCTVMGCGAPVLPVVGLAFAGLSSVTLKWLSGLSTVATALVFAGMSLGVLYYGWRVGSLNPQAPRNAPRNYGQHSQSGITVGDSISHQS